MALAETPQGAHETTGVVLPNQVVDSVDGWTTDGGVVPMMVVHVQPGVQSPGSGGL